MVRHSSLVVPAVACQGDISILDVPSVRQSSFRAGCTAAGYSEQIRFEMRGDFW